MSLQLIKQMQRLCPMGPLRWKYHLFLRISICKTTWHLKCIDCASFPAK